ncbi:MAG: hypothetical protein ABEH83_12170 [Halobacterium sp.]
MRLETESDRRRGVTLVAARVVNDGDHAVRVRVADQCGSVWPPRDEGVPAPGWDGGGWEGVVKAGETKPLGYATPAEPNDPPVEFAWTERAAGGGPSAAETFADLGDPRPPRDAVAPPTTTLPDGVREYLDGVSERARDGDATDGDREAVAALVARAGRLRREVEE